MNEIETPLIVCIYPISGQCCLLYRCLFSALRLFAVKGQKWFWPSAGALAYIKNYSSTAAIHAVILAEVCLQ
jgi:hypothetical protein